MPRSQRAFVVRAGMFAFACAVAAGCGGSGQASGPSANGGAGGGGGDLSGGTNSGGTSSGGTSSGGTSSGGTSSGGTSSGGTSSGGTSTAGSGGALGTSGGEAGAGGAPSGPCTTAAKGQLRGSAIALSSDEKSIVAVNRDVGSVSVFTVDYSSGQPEIALTKELPVGAEPWQVAIDGCGTTAYAVLRKDQKVVEITGIGTATPAVGRSVAVGSEPTSLALTPHNTKLYVSNWVDGTLSVVDPAQMTMQSTIDLNATISATGLLGPDVKGASRPGLAHPRGLAITNNLAADDSGEAVYATEWFAVRTAPESTTGTSADINWKGLLYKVPVSTGIPSTIDLPPVGNTAGNNTGFNDAKGQLTGCFPNQVASVTLDSGFAYVTSTCASPAGPTGVFQKGACGLASQCPSGPNVAACVNGACNNSCAVDSDCGVGSAVGACNLAGNPGGGVCAPLALNVKTTTHPGLTAINLTSGVAVTSTLDALFVNQAVVANGTVSTRVPLLPTDVDFQPGGFGYVASEGADALFRLTITPATGAITAVGSASHDFLDVRTPSNALVHLPIGVAVSKSQAFAFVMNDGTRDVVALDLTTQAVSASTTADVASTPLPTANSAEASQLNGKRFFNTGLDRWSLAGAAWGSCGACHIDGLTDNVTWYFARGPRQTTSLDGTFSKSDSTDQRILNWSGVNDEIADFEGNVRGISGGVGAIVSTVSTPPANTDRINTFAGAPPQQGLQGSSAALALTGAAGVNTDWQDITHWVQTVRSPSKPSDAAWAASGVTTTELATDTAAGAALFGVSGGNCVGCHSGAKWTISKLFYAPSNTLNDAFGSVLATSLSGQSWNTSLNGFPAALFPSKTTGKQTMRSGAPPTFEQLQCVLRPVGTTGAVVAGVPAGVSPAAVNVQEVRQDMVTGAQGQGGTNANDFTAGFNPPSLLGLQVGAPYFHAGNARSLEELFNDALFNGHHRSAIAQIFTPTAAQVKQLVTFLLTIDPNAAVIAIPAKSNAGGDICSAN